MRRALFIMICLLGWLAVLGLAALIVWGAVARLNRALGPLPVLATGRAPLSLALASRPSVTQRWPRPTALRGLAPVVTKEL
jgi:hypothetical protein